MQNINFEQTISAAIEGNETAFRRLYDVSSGKAYYAALCVTKSEKDAVNIIQTSYSTMRDRLPRLKYPEMFENWFYRIVCRCIYDHIIRRNSALFDSFNRLDPSEFDDELYGTYSPSTEPETAQNDRVMVTKILDHLPLDRRICFLMYYYFKMNIAEIATVISVDETIVAHFVNEGKKIVKANVNNVLSSQNRVINCSPVVFYCAVLCSCTSHVPFKATDMIFGNIFNVRNQPQQSNIKPRQVNQPQVTVSENDSTQMYSGEEIEQLLKNTGKGQQFVSYGKESSKGGDEDDIPAGESVAKIVKTVIAVIVAIIFIVAIVALLKNVVSDNDTGTTSQETQQTTAIESNTTQYETVATTAETTQAPTTTEAPSTTEPETQTEEPETEEPDADLIPYSEPPEEVTPQPVEPEIEE